MPQLDTGDLKTYYIEHGDPAGEPIILIHGNWATSSWWEPVLDRLPPGYRGVAYDMRGRGKTEGPDNDYTMEEMAADLRALLDALGIERAHLVGHSLGSAVAMQFALENPERVMTLTAIAPAWVDGMPAAYNMPAGQQMLKADRIFFATALKATAPTVPDDAYWQRLVSEGYEQSLEAALRNLPALVAWSPGDRLVVISVPALIINGALDVLTGGENAERAASALGARHVVMEGVGHSPNIEAPDQLMPLLMGHVSGVE